MNILSLIDSTSKQLISPLAEREKQRRAQIEEKIQALQAEEHYKQAEYIRKLWLDALMTDALLIGFGQAQPKLQATLNSARTGLLFVMYSLAGERNDRATIEAVVNTIVAMQSHINDKEQSPPLAILQKWAACIESARIALRELNPIKIIQGASTMAEKHPALIAHGVNLEMEERFPTSRKTLGVKTHLVTFGKAN